MFELLQQMFRLPLGLFNASLDLMRRTWQETQKATGMALQTATQGATAVLQTTAATGAAAASALTAPQTTTPPRREAWPMNGGDLGGNDLKYVTWAILFTKRDLEAELDRNEGELINYATDPASFGALKIANLLGRMLSGTYKRPEVWEKPENDYPPKNDQGQRVIPGDDLRYLTFNYQVERRIERQAADYEKRQTLALEEISYALGGRRR